MKEKERGREERKREIKVWFSLDNVDLSLVFQLRSKGLRETLFILKWLKNCLLLIDTLQ